MSLAGSPGARRISVRRSVLRTNSVHAGNPGGGMVTKIRKLLARQACGSPTGINGDPSTWARPTILHDARPLRGDRQTRGKPIGAYDVLLAGRARRRGVT